MKQKPLFFFCIITAFASICGCASQSLRTAKKLDPLLPQYQSAECQKALKAANDQENIRRARLILSPLLTFVSAGTLALPVVALNSGLETVDYSHASKMALDCGGKEKSTQEVTFGVLTSAGMGLLTNGLGSGINPTLK
ncbi:MAG: hypothetical protein WCH96_13330 [Betaproteobacteria bacterium]